MKLITIRGNLFIYVDKLNNISMTKNMDQLRSSRFVMSRFFMKSMDKIELQLKRCRVLKLMNKFESIFKWQVMTAEHVEEYLFHGEMKHVQAKRQR